MSSDSKTTKPREMHTKGTLSVDPVRPGDKDINITCTGPDGGDDCRIVVDRDDCDTETAEANAARLALCWNSHDAMKKAIEEVADEIDTFGDSLAFEHLEADDDEDEPLVEITPSALSGWMKTLRAALPPSTQSK